MTLNMNKTLQKLSTYAQMAALSIIPPLQGTRITQTQPCERNAPGGTDIVNCTLGRITTNGLNLFFAILTGLAIILMIWAGIQYIQALGSGERVKAARQRIINIVIAIIILVAAYTILNLLVDLASYLAGKVPR
jgi:hypothetical protein